MGKMRQEFEAWAKTTSLKNFLFRRPGDGQYEVHAVQAAFDGLKASRAALCVELPVWTLKNGADYFDYHKADDVKALCDEAGVSYK